MQPKPMIRRELATAHRYGQDIARGPFVYCAYDGNRLVCVCATAGEAKRRYREAYDVAQGRVKPADGLPPSQGRRWSDGQWKT
jgi:hypothetical protein